MVAYIFLRVPNTLKVHSDSATLRISKKDLNIPDEEGTFNIITHVIKSNKTGNRSLLTHRRSYLPNNSFNSNGEVKARNGKLMNLKKLKKRKTNFNKINRYELESKESAIRETKNARLITKNVSLNHSNITEKCIFSMDKNSLSEARKELSTSQSVYLFFINLRFDKHHSFNSSERDMLFHWQYVLKKEKFLVQLPVDFDLFTFRLLSADSEETVLDVILLYNNSNCDESENLAEKIHSVRALLWNELFQNDTRFYLCNRNIETQDEWSWRKIQYYITTIWVGYDLSCSEVNDKYGIHEVQLTKDDLPLVTPIFCYFLSLQFVWIFVLLDAYKLTREDELTNYTENDRPYSTKRFIQKILYKECYCICYCWCDICKICKCPSTRLLFLTWLFILLPVGLYRTLGRFYILDKEIYQDYVTVVKPSESFLNIKKSEDEHLILAIDSIYATCAPLIFVFIGGILYRAFVRDEKDKTRKSEAEGEEGNVKEKKRLIKPGKRTGYTSIQVQESGIGNTEQKTRHSTHSDISEKFSKPSEVLFQHLMSLISCNCFNICSSGENELDKNKNEKNICFRCDRYSKKMIENENEKTHCSCSCVLNFLLLLLYLLYVTISFTIKILLYPLRCLFPIIPFSCTTVFPDFVHRVVNGKWKLPHKAHTFLWEFLTLIQYLLALIQFLVLYIICLRPIISTFSFLLRAFTYFVFVALLIRTHILQFTLIFVTTLVYFSKYFSEIVNMNGDILKYTITLQKNREQNNKQNNEQPDEHIGEEKFTYIYEKLAFVRKKIYILCLKTLVIFMYLFITIETFIRNKNSLNTTSVKSIVEFLLLLISPYAISFFIKTNKGDFLSDENKKEIKQIYEEFEKKNQPNEIV